MALWQWCLTKLEYIRFWNWQCFNLFDKFPASFFFSQKHSLCFGHSHIVNLVYVQAILYLFMFGFYVWLIISSFPAKRFRPMRENMHMFSYKVTLVSRLCMNKYFLFLSFNSGSVIPRSYRSRLRWVRPLRLRSPTSFSRVEVFV